MGNSASQQEQAGSVGYRVLGVQPNSPASEVGLVSFFDFIVAVRGVELKRLDNVLVNVIKESEGRPLQMSIYNCKNHSVREVNITPARMPTYAGLLGVTIRFDSYYNAEENIVRVLSVVKNGPADLAGLKAETDYLLGTAEHVFKDADALLDELTKHLDEAFEVYVYSTESDEVRIVVIMPTLQWAGSGCLGAEVAHGYLHRLPQRNKESIGISTAINISVVATDATLDEPSADTPPTPLNSIQRVEPIKTIELNDIIDRGATEKNERLALPAASCSDSAGIIDVDLSASATSVP